MKKLILITGLLLCSSGWAEQSNPCHQYYPNIPGELHESGNTGDESNDLVWVTLKPGCMDGN